MYQFSTLVLLWSAICAAPSVLAFVPSQRLHSTAVPTTRGSPLSSAAVSLPNPFKKLPWNVKKEREREERRRKVERAKLHRQLGIAEDATYEEIVEATDRLILAAGKDIKQKVQVEVAKDKILQFRLNERLAGLQADSKEARAMSNYEVEG
jgi:Protein CHAPERONE-LIKE PROTEIN OF POR1-like